MTTSNQDMQRTSRSRKGRASSFSNDANASAPNESSQAVAERAYEKFVARGGTDGFDVQDWLEAERELGAHELSNTEREWDHAVL